MKGFIFGLLVGAAGAIACLHYSDQAHIDKIHELAGIETAAPAAEEAAPAVEEAAPAAEEAAPAMEEAADMADDAMADEAAPAEEAAAEGETP